MGFMSKLRGHPADQEMGSLGRDEVVEPVLDEREEVRAETSELVSPTPWERYETSTSSKEERAEAEDFAQKFGELSDLGRILSEIKQQVQASKPAPTETKAAVGAAPTMKNAISDESQPVLGVPVHPQPAVRASVSKLTPKKESNSASSRLQTVEDEQELDSISASFSQASDPARVRQALTEVTSSVQRVIETLPNATGPEDDAWANILEDMRLLSVKRERLIEIERELETTIEEIDAAIQAMKSHIDTTIRSEEEKAATYQLRSQVAKSLSGMLRRL